MLSGNFSVEQHHRDIATVSPESRHTHGSSVTSQCKPGQDSCNLRQDKSCRANMVTKCQRMHNCMQGYSVHHIASLRYLCFGILQHSRQKVEGCQPFAAGAIAGGVIGALAALAGLAAVVACFVVRQRRQKRAVPATIQATPFAAPMAKAMSGDEVVGPSPPSTCAPAVASEHCCPPRLLGGSCPVI